MASPNEDAPKIIVDDDWKNQAQAEKQKLSDEVAEKQAQAEQARQLPPADFTTLLNSLAMQTVMALQGMEDPNTKQRLIDLQLAKFHIDLLGVLDEKTKGNLNEEEATLMERSLAELRMNFVHISENAKQMSPEEMQSLQQQPPAGDDAPA
jgi:hypothetical protein